MKYRILLLALLWSSLAAAAGRVKAYLDLAAFDAPGQSPYVESYLNVVGSSVRLVPVKGGKFQASIEVQWLFRKDDQIVFFDKYNLLGPEVDTSLTPVSPDFIDQVRVPLQAGEYKLEVRIRDNHTDAEPVSVVQPLTLRFPEKQVGISDVEFLESMKPTNEKSKFTKSGFDLIPNVHSFYPKEIQTLRFYSEIYRTKELIGGDFLVRYFIVQNESNVVQTDFAGMKKMAADDVVPLLVELPIEKLLSGNYQLVIEVRDRENKVLGQRTAFFQRSNVLEKPVVSENISAIPVEGTFASLLSYEDTLREAIACLYPISSQLELQIAETQLKISDIRSMQQFLNYFWTRHKPEDPERGWRDYQREVQKVNAAYSTRNMRGYETDRGRVYLQYGPPNTIVSETTDPNSYPYEIWHYYKAGEQTNRRFVFYSTDLSSNMYRLLHSDARGELQEPNWELKLHSRSQQFGVDFDQGNSFDTYGSQTKENFRMPK
jgi:GWxTD domain-containing protein